METREGGAMGGGGEDKTQRVLLDGTYIPSVGVGMMGQFLFLLFYFFPFSFSLFLLIVINSNFYLD
jgi:hypothetical protein